MWSQKSLLRLNNSLARVTIIPFLDYFTWLPPLYLSIFLGDSIFSPYLPVWVSFWSCRLNLLTSSRDFHSHSENQSLFIAYKHILDFSLHFFYPLLLAQSMPAMPCSFWRIWTCCFLFCKVFSPNIYPYVFFLVFFRSILDKGKGREN